MTFYFSINRDQAKLSCLPQDIPGRYNLAQIPGRYGCKSTKQFLIKICCKTFASLCLSVQSHIIQCPAPMLSTLEARPQNYHEIKLRLCQRGVFSFSALELINLALLINQWTFLMVSPTSLQLNLWQWNHIYL